MHKYWLTALRAAFVMGPFVLSVLLSSCGGGGSAGNEPQPPQGTADSQLLFFGNSHTQGHDLPELVRALVAAARPGRTVAAVREPNFLFLDTRLTHTPSLELLQSRSWQAVVLQAQRYSSSGTVTYSTEEAKAWVLRVRAGGGVPVLFPEWPRRDIDETARIFELHSAIAREAAACVAPIPQAFDAALRLNSSLVLHASDGNHSSAAGALLAAMVIATTITGRAPADHPPLTAGGVSEAEQATLRQAATAAVAATSPWAWCPADRPVGAP